MRADGHRDGIVGPAPRHGQFATCQRNLGKRGDVDDRQLGLDAHQLPSLLGGAGRRLHVTRGQGRGGQRRAGEALGELAEVRGAMHSRGRGGPCSCRVAAIDEQVAQADETGQPPAVVVRGFGLDNEVAELRDGAGDVALPPLRQSHTPAARPQVVAVTDRLGNIASFFAGREHRSRIALSGDRRERLETQDLAQAPVITQCAGEAECLIKVRACGLGVEGC